MGRGMGTNVAPWGAPVAAPAAAGAGCQPVYGPVANVCHSAIPITGSIPVTMITPVPNTVTPGMAMGPATAAPMGGKPAFGMPAAMPFPMMPMPGWGVGPTGAYSPMLNVTPQAAWGPWGMV